MMKLWHHIRPAPRPPIDLERAASPRPAPEPLGPQAHAVFDTWVEHSPQVAHNCMQRCARTLSASVQGIAHPERRHPPKLDPECGAGYQDV